MKNFLALKEWVGVTDLKLSHYLRRKRALNGFEIDHVAKRTTWRDPNGRVVLVAQYGPGATQVKFYKPL